MNLTQHKIKISNSEFGNLVDETFVNASQFKLFLKLVQGCLETKNDLTFFNGVDFLVHIPFKILTSSIIVTSLEPYSLSEHLITKSKIEALETK